MIRELATVNRKMNSCSDRMQDIQTLIQRIHTLKQEKNAVILTHNYCRPEVQDIADFVGDSLGLSRQAVQQDVDVIVFCGVDFMAESAAILCPEKTVLIPDRYARCPMAAMADVESLREIKRQYPDAAVVSYVNSSAGIKAESDICCTSANAIEVVRSLDVNEVIFVPDRNLGYYVSLHTDKKIILWDGYCPTHNQIRESDLRSAKATHPDAKVLAHPECRREVLELADHILSTTGMMHVVSSSANSEFVVATEKGIIHPLAKENPDKKFYQVSDFVICPDMKTTDLKSVCSSLEKMEHVIEVPEDIRACAKQALDRMFDIGRG